MRFYASRAAPDERRVGEHQPARSAPAAARSRPLCRAAVRRYGRGVRRRSTARSTRRSGRPPSPPEDARRREAPSPTRTAICLRRSSARASRKLARLVQASSSRSLRQQADQRSAPHPKGWGNGSPTWESRHHRASNIALDTIRHQADRDENQGGAVKAREETLVDAVEQSAADHRTGHCQRGHRPQQPEVFAVREAHPAEGRDLR